MRKHRSHATDSAKPPSSSSIPCKRSAAESITPLPWPSPASARLSLSSSSKLARDRSDGPRSLPTKRLAYKWGASLEGPSYSSFARLAGRDDSPTVVASVSLPPAVEGEGVRLEEGVTYAGGRRAMLGGSRMDDVTVPVVAAPMDPALLARSDSLLNKARRVFSLPTGLKKRPGGGSSNVAGAAAVPDGEKRERRRAVKKVGKVVEAGSLRPSAAAAARKDDSGMNDLEGRIRWLEDELEAARVRNSRQRRRIVALEEQVDRDRQARPAVETLIQSALRHFEAKESALKHTIERMDQDYATVLAEKNEAMRLLTAFVGRGGRSPPASFSSVSEGGSEGGSHYKASRRAMSMDAVRRGNTSTVIGGRTQGGSLEYEGTVDKRED